MSHFKKIVLVSCAALSLSGCQSLSGSNGMAANSVRPMTQSDQREILALAALAKGREQLTAGNLAAAADAFRLAQRDSATMADASNGLGVVYVRMQRMDLAERYFRIAASLEPENPRFAANLGRMERDVTLARMERDGSDVEESPMLARLPAAAGSGRFALDGWKQGKVPDGTVQGEPIRIELPAARPVDAPAPVAHRREVNVAAAQARTEQVAARTVKVALPVAKPMDQNEFIDSEGKLRRISAKESCIWIGDGVSAAPIAKVIARDMPKAAQANAEGETDIKLAAS